MNRVTTQSGRTVNQGSKLNRHSSSERLLSPDRSDALPAVSHPPKLLFLVGAMVLVLLACAWLAFGLIDTRIKGRCILVSPQGVAEISSNAEGRLEGLQVKTGDLLQAGQVIAQIRRPEFDQKLTKAAARLAELRAGKKEVDALIERSLTLERGNAMLDQRNVLSRQKTLEARLLAARDRLQAQQKLFDQGLVTRQNLLAAEQHVETLSLEQSQLASRAKQLAFQLQEEQRGLKGDAAQLTLQIEQAERELAALRGQQDNLMQIRSEFAGRVVELKAQNGMVLSIGSGIATIERGVAATEGIAPPLLALIFVDAADGKLLQSGMAAEITPTNVKRQEFGFIRAAIGSVSDFPASREAIGQLLQNPGAVRELTGDRVPTQVTAQLLRRSNGGYEWSGAARLPPQVRSGSMCGAEVVVRERRPIEFLWPLLKKITGVT
jgi:HlyD family secretion protein